MGTAEVKNAWSYIPPYVVSWHVQGQITYLLTYFLTHSMQRSPAWEANRFSASQEIPTFYGTQRFITAFKSARHLSLSSTRSIHSIPPTYWKSILILSSHLRLDLPSGLFHSDFPTKTLYTPFLSLVHATCLVHLILLDFITRTILGEQCSSLSSSLCSFLQSPVTSSLLGPNILLNSPFSNILSLRSSLSVSDQFVQGQFYLLLASPRFTF